MPTITATTDETDKARPKSAKLPQVAASTCLTKYLYNIPPGVITVTVPGVIMLMIGVVLVILPLTVADQSHLADGLPLIAVIIVVVGGAWTLLALGFWVTTCFHYRLSTSNKSTKRLNRKSSVELVAVSWRDDSLQTTSLDSIHYYNCAT